MTYHRILTGILSAALTIICLLTGGCRTDAKNNYESLTFLREALQENFPSITEVYTTDELPLSHDYHENARKNIVVRLSEKPSDETAEKIILAVLSRLSDDEMLDILAANGFFMPESTTVTAGIAVRYGGDYKQIVTDARELFGEWHYASGCSLGDQTYQTADYADHRKLLDHFYPLWSKNCDTEEFAFLAEALKNEDPALERIYFRDVQGYGRAGNVLVFELSEPLTPGNAKALCQGFLSRLDDERLLGLIKKRGLLPTNDIEASLLFTSAIDDFAVIKAQYYPRHFSGGTFYEGVWYKNWQPEWDKGTPRRDEWDNWYLDLPDIIDYEKFTERLSDYIPDYDLHE